MKKTTLLLTVLAAFSLIVLVGSAEGRIAASTALKAQAVTGPHAVSRMPGATGAQIGELEIGYDTGAELYSPDDDVLNAEWSVRFTPPQTCSLSYVEIVTFERSGAMQLTVYADDGTGAPGSMIAGPYQFTATGDLTYQQIVFPTPIDVGMDDFHVGVEIIQSLTPHPTFDGDGGTLRTAYRASGSAWSLVENLDMVLRAFVRPYGADETPPLLLHIPSELVFSDDGPVTINAKIDDPSGIQTAAVYHSTDGLNYQSTTLALIEGIYTATIPAHPAGTNVRYYLWARDNATTLNTGVLPESGSAAPFSYIVQPGAELSNDDGMPEEFWVESDIYDGNAFGVYLRPSSYPAVVSHLRVLVDDTASVVLTVQSFGTGIPGDVIAGPFVGSANPFSGWIDITIPEGERPTITSGGLYVVMYWFPQTPTLPGVATDITQPNGRSLWYDNAFGWNQYSTGNWIMRAGVQTPTGIVELGTQSRPTDWRLRQNAPNPFNPSTQIGFSLPRASHATLNIHNIMGQLVRELHAGNLEAGEYSIDWDGQDQSGRRVSSGVYFYTLSTESFTETRKMLLLK